jgi:hypothetical protein
MPKMSGGDRFWTKQERMLEQSTIS